MHEGDRDDAKKQNKYRIRVGLKNKPSPRSQPLLYVKRRTVRTTETHKRTDLNRRMPQQQNITYIQGVSRLVDINAGGDFLGRLCDQKSSNKHVSDFGRLRSYDRLKLRIEVNDY